MVSVQESLCKCPGVYVFVVIVGDRGGGGGGGMCPERGGGGGGGPRTVFHNTIKITYRRKLRTEENISQN